MKQAERVALNERWRSHSTVKAFHAAVLNHAMERNLAFDAAGMTAVAGFAKQWLTEHGPLPDSGIKTG